MLNKLAKIIEKHPLKVISIIVIITIVFSLFIPSLQFKTNFEDFAPDNELVKSNNRITSYFGTNQEVMFLLIENKKDNNVITTQALKEQYILQKKLSETPEINNTVSIATFVDTICQMEYNKNLDQCTDEEIKNALNDLLNETIIGETRIFNEDDQNELDDYPNVLLNKKQENIDSIDIKNCYINKDDTNITFSFEMYDVSDIFSKIEPSIPRTHTIEWFIGFENSLSPKGYDIKYQISVRIQPNNDLWEIGKGLIKNIQDYIQLIKNHEIKSYNYSSYINLEIPGQEISFPIELTTSKVTINEDTNRINLTISRKELGNYGIAPQYGSFEIPSKLTNFKAGIRYTQTQLLHLPEKRISLNTSFLFNSIQRLQTHQIIWNFFTKILQNQGLLIEEFNNLSDKMTEMLPDSISLKDFGNLWIYGDIVQDEGTSKTIYPIIPQLFNDLKINGLSFVSDDYKQTKKPTASIIIIQLEKNSDSDKSNSIYNNIINNVKETQKTFTYLSAEVTGEGIITNEISDSAMSSNIIIGPMIFIIIVLILFINFRKPSYVFLPIIVFAFSSIWLFGTMALLGVSFNVIAVALLPLNIGLGVEYSVNILHNYRVELEKGKTPKEAILRSIKEVGAAIFLAWFTTFVAFLSFLSASIPPVRDFGIFLALGITYTFIITMTLLVSLRYLIDKKKQITVQKKNERISARALVERLPKYILKHEKILFVLTIIICIIMGGAITQLKSGFSMDQFLPEDSPSLIVFSKIEENFPFSSQDQEYILIEGNIASTQTLIGISNTHNKLKNDQYVARKTDGSPKTESIYIIIEQAISNNQSLITSFNIDPKTSIPKTDYATRLFYNYLYDSDEYATQVKNVLYKDNDGEYKATLIRVFIDSSLSSNNEDMTESFKTLKNELNEDLDNYGDTKTSVTGTILITSTILLSMTESQITSTGICLILAAIMLSLIFKNPVLGLITMIPVSVSIICVLGTMYFLGYTLNILTITVTCITVGVGIDYGCYITERFKIVADKTGNITEAVIETISRTGSAILIAAMASMFGFAVLFFAPIPPQQQFGIITAITLIYAFVASITILPLVLARWANWRKKRKGYIISPGAPDEKYLEDVKYKEIEE